MHISYILYESIRTDVTCLCLVTREKFWQERGIWCAKEGRQLLLTIY